MGGLCGRGVRDKVEGKLSVSSLGLPVKRGPLGAVISGVESGVGMGVFGGSCAGGWVSRDNGVTQGSSASLAARCPVTAAQQEG